MIYQVIYRIYIRSFADSDGDAVGAPPTWVLSGHDTTRHVTRYGRPCTRGEGSRLQSPEPVDRVFGLRRAWAALLLMLALSGGVYLYRGEELGPEELEDLPEEALQDPTWQRSGHTVRGRDGCRVPLPWRGTRPPFGFGPGDTRPWLPQPRHWALRTVERQESDPNSMLTLYRAALHLRAHHPALGAGRGRGRPPRFTGRGHSADHVPTPSAPQAPPTGRRRHRSGFRVHARIPAHPPGWGRRRRS